MSKPSTMFTYLLFFSQISILLLITNAVLPISGQCLDDQKSSLLLMLSNSSRPKSWLPDTDCCFWEGVECDLATGHVIGLHLFISDPINSTTFIGLSNLQHLNLSSSSFSSPISTGLNHLSHMTHRKLSNSGFTAPHNVSGQCLEYQKSALLQTFSNYPSLLSWRSDGSDCCLWDGIKCDDVTGHVIELDVTNHYISGPINSSTFASLSTLRFLNLAYNNFNSPIPSNLDALSNLTHLNLSNSGFTGQIPVAIAHMTQLVSLDISMSSLSSLSSPLTFLRLEDPSIDTLLQNLSGLRKLHLDGVNVSSSVPDFLSNFTNLTSLSLSYCQLVGEFPRKIFQLPKLETLDVSMNTLLNGFLPEFPRENALQTLLLTSTGFSGQLPDSCGNLRNLTKLQLSSCKFNGPIPSSVKSIRRIVLLDLRLNSFSGSIPSLENLAELEYLDLSKNNFSGPIPSLVNQTRLRMLDLSMNSFSGEIPPLDSLKSITEIVLSSNNLTGMIPNFYEGGLRNLNVLDLRNNSLFGRIPSFLFTLPALQTLLLSKNQLTGQLDEFNHTSLTLVTIDLSSNILQGQIPRSLFDFNGLKVLDLSSNNFSGTVQLAVLQNLKNLSTLDLSHNSLSVDSTATNSSFPQLGRLYLSSCNLTEFPDFLRSQSKMENLDLSNNNIDGEIPSWMWNIGDNGYLFYLNLSKNLLAGLQHPHNLSFISNLFFLDLHSNQLQGLIPLPPPSIFVLDYSNNRFTSGISSNFASSLGAAIFFSISDNNISGGIPPSICNASYLQVLDLSNNHLTGPIPACLFEKNVLKLRNNRLTGILPEISTENCNLRTLDLNGNRLEGKMPKSLSRCRELEVLDVGNNHLNGPFPYVGNKSKLRVLVLRSNQFNGSLSQPLDISFPMLQIIDLSSNSFSGNLPPNFLKGLNAMMSREDDEDPGFYNQIIRYSFLPGSYYQETVTGLYYQDTVTVRSKGLEMELVKILTIFKSMDLSNNKFQGEIPEEIGGLNLLHVLNMSNNGLMGRIPASIGNLTRLESLDLSQNKLSGEIPQQLTDLTFLSVLDLSENQLVGLIPSGRQFQTFSNDSFMGNLGLCGLPLSRKCDSNATKAPPPPSATKGVGSRSSRHVNWQLIWVEVGYVTGVAAVFLPLLFWREWRWGYFRRVDAMIAYFYDQWHSLT